jgi:hypothetical protein
MPNSDAERIAKLEAKLDTLIESFEKRMDRLETISPLPMYPVRNTNSAAKTLSSGWSGWKPARIDGMATSSPPSA